MRLAALVLSALVLAGPGVARAAAPEPPAAAQNAERPAAKPEAKGSDRWGDGRATADPREQPSHGAPYNWRQMSFGAAIMLAMLGFVVWIIRRQTRSR